MTGSAPSEPTRGAYLQAATVAATLLAAPAVEATWREPSALPKLSVGGLATHLARQVLRVAEVLAGDPSPTDPISLSAHYARSAWVTAGLDDESNVSVRENSEAKAGAGAAAVRESTRAALDRLHAELPGQPADRVVALPWASWSLSLDDFLVTRLVEIAVHNDDLAVSVDLPPPPLPEPVWEPVLGLLVQLAARRHGPTAVLRALSRAERAPAAISAF